jgi:hypothetical protein
MQVRNMGKNENEITSERSGMEQKEPGSVRPGSKPHLLGGYGIP